MLSELEMSASAVKMDGKVVWLLECKSAGMDLKDNHVRQATNYSADSEIEWVALTNGIVWRIYKIIFAKPVDKQLVYEFNLCETNTKKQSDLEMLYYLCAEAFSKSTKGALEDLHLQKQIINRFIISQTLLAHYNYISEWHRINLKNNYHQRRQ